jgi:MULE transposase-like protein
MRTPKTLYRTSPTLFMCELSHCPQCEGPLSPVGYVTGQKTIQTMQEGLTIAYRPKTCYEKGCRAAGHPLPSAAWQHLAPKYSTYGYDVIAHIGWERQVGRTTFDLIQARLRPAVQVSESMVRYLYHQKYLPLLACQEREHLAELQTLARTRGLILGLDGLVVEGGEPQLWVVRELQSEWTLRCGWLSSEDEATFTAFLQPIADLNLRVRAVISDKQRGLIPAVARVFPQAQHGFCQTHYFKNVAAPVAEADEQMKIALRQAVREEVGDLIRQKQAEKPTVLTVTGLLPSPLADALSTTPPPATPVAPALLAEREALVQDLLRRVRYLLTLKGRAPFRLAGVEMYDRLQEVVQCLNQLLRYQPEPRLEHLRAGLRQALKAVRADSAELHQAAAWLEELADRLDPERHPARTGKAVRKEWQACLDRIETEATASPRLTEWSAKMLRVSESYAPGLFYTYDLPGLPRTNNGRESEFRDVRRRLLATTGQVGATKRLLQREGAWELIPRLPSLSETVEALSQVDPHAFQQERARVQAHRDCFRLHTRSAKQSQGQLKNIIHRWKALPAVDGSK